MDKNKCNLGPKLSRELSFPKALKESKQKSHRERKFRWKYYFKVLREE